MGFFDSLRKPTPDRFAAQLIKRLRAAGLADEFQYNSAELRIVRLRDGASVGEINLGNLFRGYEALPRAERPAYLGHCVQMVLSTGRELPSDFDAAAPDLRAKFTSRAALENLRLRGLLAGDDKDALDLPGETIGTHLFLGPVYDWPQTSQSINADQLATWGVTLYEALEVARRNLDETLEGYAKIGDGLYLVRSGDSYDAARLILVDRIRGMEVVGKHVAMVPNRETLLVTGADDADGLAMLAALAEDGLKQPRPLSGTPLILEDDGWRDWMPPPDHPLYRTFRNMETNWLGPLYAEQKEMLEALHEARAIDRFVASFSAVQKPDGLIVSYCVWGEGVDALLPVTQKVVIARAAEEGFAALGDWPRVREVAGHLMEETEHYPPRYRVRDIPDQALLDAIGVGEL